MLNNGDKLIGLMGQSMGGPKVSPNIPVPTVYEGIGAFSYTIPRSGKYKIFAWGAGGPGSNGYNGEGGGSGALCIATAYLVVGQVITGSVPSSVPANINPSDATVTLPGGRVLTAGSGKYDTTNTGGAGGVASGGDVNYNGSRGGVKGGLTNGRNGGGEASWGGAGGVSSPGLGGGAGAPGAAPYRGGAGGAGSSNGTYNGSLDPGGGGGGGPGDTRLGFSGSGRVIIALIET